MARPHVTIFLLLSGAFWLAACDAPPVTHTPAPRGRISGVVLDPVAERPVPGVRVQAHDMGGTWTDASGRFELSLPPGEHRLWLHRDGFIDGQRAHLRVRAGQDSEVEVRLFEIAPDDAALHHYMAQLQSRRDARALAPELSGRPDLSNGDHVLAGARAALTEPMLPAVIRVWRSSRAGALAPSSGNGWADNSCDPAVEVDILPLEDYVKGVLPHEWSPSWDPQALRAGAIAARTFGVKWALRGGRWACADVDDGTVTQVYRDDRAASADAAVDATASQVVTRADVVISTEYSAENSDPTATGVDDPTCAGTTLFGHGRGMCQWGTQRWAKGICANPPCDFGVFGPEPKNYTWMVEHYYPGAIVVAGRATPPPPCQLIPAEGDILDDAGPCFDAFGDPIYWRTETVGYAGGLRWTNAFEAAAPGNWARWRMFFDAPGEYAVDVYIEPTFGVHRMVRYSVAHAGGDAEVFLDQGAADGWTRLGMWTFDAQGEVSVYDNEAAPVAADQHIVADAIRLVPTTGAPSDAGSDAGADASADAGTDAGTDASTDTMMDAGDSLDGAVLDADIASHGGHARGGCGCVLVPARPVSPSTFLLLSAGLLIALRRRSR